VSNIRLLIVDDHTLVRQGVRSLLETQNDIEVIAEAAGGHEAIAKAAELHPDVILMDLAMPDLSGMEATRRLKTEHPQIQVLALTMHDTEDYLIRTLESGASGYVLKEADAAELAAAIRAVHAGGAYIYPSLAKRLIERIVLQADSGRGQTAYDTLTAREKEILTLIGEGLINDEIAQKLSLSHHTVQSHRSNILKKLGLRNRAQLVSYAARAGMVARQIPDICHS
jgi:two-component system response regulator NreC